MAVAPVSSDKNFTKLRFIFSLLGVYWFTPRMYRAMA
jgi:hypothetical protein